MMIMIIIMGLECTKEMVGRSGRAEDERAG
jgi:hypothetical protein